MHQYNSDVSCTLTLDSGLSIVHCDTSGCKGHLSSGRGTTAAHVATPTGPHGVRVGRVGGDGGVADLIRGNGCVWRRQLWVWLWVWLRVSFGLDELLLCHVMRTWTSPTVRV